MARRLLLVGGMAGCVSACVIPPPGDFAEGDAGPSSPPVIMSSAPPFEFPEITVQPNEQGRIVLTLRDVDVDDTLYVKLYVDYGRPNPTASLAECTAVPTGEQQRLADCSAANLCPISDGAEHLLEAMVADLDFLPEGDPAFRALPPTAAFSIRGWVMTCTPAT